MANAVGSVFDPAAVDQTLAGSSRFPVSNTGNDGPGYETITGLMTYVNANVTAPAGALTGATLASNVVTSSLTAVGTLVNLTVTNTITGSVSGNAATVTTNANLTGDVTSVGNATSIATGVIVNADVNASAAIAVSKLAAITASRAVVSDGSGFVSAATTTATEIGYVNGVTSAIQTQINAKAATTQTGEGMGGLIGGSLADGDLRVFIKMPHAGTITETTTRSTAGTCTATFKVNTTALGGTANSVSTSEQSQAHASTNTFAADDDIVITISSNSSCANMSFMIKYTRVYTA